MLVALGLLAAHQTQATDNTYLRALGLLDYTASHPNATFHYVAINMVLHIHSNASYLSELKYQSRSGGYYLLGYCSHVAHQPPSSESAINSPIFTLSKILSNFMASAAEAEIDATFINGQEDIPIRTTLAKLVHAQPPTPLCVDNSTASGFSNDAMKQKISKAIDIRFYWVQYCTLCGQFLI